MSTKESSTGTRAEERRTLSEDEWISLSASSFDPADAPPFPVPKASESRPSDDSMYTLRAVLSGAVLSVSCRKGEWVEQGADLLILEAMKMENRIGAPVNGRVESVRVQPGDIVKVGDVLIRLARLETPETKPERGTRP